MSERVYTILKAPDYSDWYKEQPFKDRAQIEDRLLKIQNAGYFGTHKCVDDNEIYLGAKMDGRKKNLLRIYSSPKNIAPPRR